MIKLTQQQGEAVKAAKQWFTNPRSPQVFRLFGPAGTGKSTIAQTLADELGKNVGYLAPTGKAVEVLRKKGCNPASTIHRAIYKAQQDESTGKWSYLLTSERLAGLDLLIVDEAPMVSRDVALDLLSVAPKVLALGDPWQLPPPKGEEFFGSGEPDFTLTEIRRQALDNPIIALSILARDKKPIKLGKYGSSRVAKGRELSDEMLLNHSQILVGTNLTRKMLNDRYRKATGRTSFIPSAGEKLMCLKNERERGFMNGSVWYTAKSSILSSGDVFSHVVRDDDWAITQEYPEDSALVERILTPIQYFEGTEAELDWRDRKSANEFCFAYACTGHKFQGSQAPSVLILNQSKVFKESAHRWLYTCLTRAEEELTLLV